MKSETAQAASRCTEQRVVMKYPPHNWEYIGKLNATPDNGCGFAVGDIVIADSWKDGTASIRPYGELGPTLLSVPDRFIDRIHNSTVCAVSNKT